MGIPPNWRNRLGTGDWGLGTYTKNVPRAFMLFIRSYRFISVCKVGVSEIALALLTRISIPPNYSEKCSKMTGKMFKCFPTGNQNGQINIKWITTQTFSTALCTTDLTCCSSRTSNISGSAFPPAASTTLSTNEVNKQNVKL